MLNLNMLSFFIGFYSFIWYSHVQQGLTEQKTINVSSIQQRMVETVVPPYCMAYTTLNERIVKQLLAVNSESDEETIRILAKSLLCAAKYIHDQLHNATQNIK